ARPGVTPVPSLPPCEDRLAPVLLDAEIVRLAQRAGGGGMEPDDVAVAVDDLVAAGIRGRFGAVPLRRQEDVTPSQVPVLEDGDRRRRKTGLSGGRRCRRRATGRGERDGDEGCQEAKGAPSAPGGGCPTAELAA